MFLIFNVILVCVVIADSVHCRNDIKEQASKELIRYSDMVRDNIDAFSKCEMEDVEKFMADNFPEGSYSLTYRLDDQHYANIEPDEDLLVHIECIAENPYGEIRLLLNPTYYDYWGNELKLIDLEEATFENLNLGSSPSEITEPCFWAFYKAKDEKTELYISFSQNAQMYIRENSKIYNKTLQYYYENNHLSLYSNDFWKTENIEFNNEQKKIFEDYLKEEFYKSKPNLKSLYDHYDVHYDLSYKVYNIEYNKKTACYNVIFDYIAFYTIVYDDVLVGVNNLYEYDELVLDGEQDDLNAYINTVKMTFYMENDKINKATINEYFDDINMWQSPIMFNMFGEEFHSNSSSLTTHSDYINFLNEKYNTKKYYEAEEFENGEFIVGVENGDTYDFRSLKEVLNQ